MSIHKVAAGHGYAYLLRSVVQGDGDHAAPDKVTRYYLEAGTPPGMWLGSAVANFAGSIARLQAGDVVTPVQLKRLIGAGRNPLNGGPLGRDFAEYKPIAERIAHRVSRLDESLTGVEREQAVARIEAEEHRAGDKHAVAGFDLTFSVPKSVSVLWALADANTQARIVEAHHAAVCETLDLLERQVAATRRGARGIEQADVTGVAAAAYDHWDSRANDPQLHTHVVVSNKVKTADDGVWRALDARGLYGAAVALSEHYDAVLRDRLTGTFALAWERRPRGRDRHPQWEIDGISEDLIVEFSSRTAAINAETERLKAAYVARHGRQPPARVVARLRAQATLATRPAKQIHSLHDLTEWWRRRAEPLAPDADPVGLARRLTTTSTGQVYTAADVPDDTVERAAAQTLAVVSDKRATWGRWNLWAEASRQTMGWRFSSAAEREQIITRVVDAAETHSVRLTPDELAPTPATLRRADGSSRLRPQHHAVYSSEQVLADEDRLLALAEDRTAPVLPDRTVAAVVHREAGSRRPSAEQASAVAQVAGSGRVVDVLVGPAGAGKTTTMRALVRAWTTRYGPGSVVGLAPSATAAKVLADDVGQPAETTAKWLTEHYYGRTRLARSQLVIVDEATLTGTRTLARLATLAADAGAKLLLTGDPAQLQAVDTGGAFAMLVNQRNASGDPAPALGQIHRFRHAWEKHASLALRDGRPEAITAYSDHGRIQEGTGEDMIDAAYAAWLADVARGTASILVADATAIVVELNRRSRADRILAGRVDPRRAVVFDDGTEAAVGDLVITRHNDRGLRTPRGGFVRNGDRWQITSISRDGAVRARRVLPGQRRDATARLGGTVTLPKDYVAKHLDLGYAVTAYRAQGVTVDTAHVVVPPTTTRENLYVAMTRGREANIAYVATDDADDVHAPPAPEERTARTVLYGVLAHSGAELSAHETIRAEHEQWTGRDRLIAEYEHIADIAQKPRWTALVLSALTGAGRLTADEAADAVRTDAFGPLCRKLRRVEALGYDVERLLPLVAGQRTLLTADDVCAVLGARVARATSVAERRSALGRQAVVRRVRSPRMIAGVVPEALGDLPDDVREALDERARQIEQSAQDGAPHEASDEPCGRARRPLGRRERANQAATAMLSLP